MRINIADFQPKANRLLLSCLLWISLIGLINVSHAAAASEPPLQLVIQATENLVTQLSKNEQAIKTTPSLAFELANKDVIPLFDFHAIARSVLGQHWRDATREQRIEFEKNFRTFIINLYTSAMVTYSKEIITTANSFKYSLPNWQINNSTATIFMEFKLKGMAPIKVGYKMHKRENTWKIYDVHVLGMSAAALYRINFNSEIKRFGLQGLLERLAAKNKTGTYSRFVEHADVLKAN